MFKKIALLIMAFEWSCWATEVAPSSYYLQFVSGLTRQQMAQVAAGESLATKPWVTAPSSTYLRDGLGPLFNAASCVSCHHNLGKGRPPISAQSPDHSLVILFEDHSREFDRWGGQLQVQAIAGVESEGPLIVTYDPLEISLGDGATVELVGPNYQFNKDVHFSPRIAPLMIGLGLVEKIAYSVLSEFEDEFDRDRDGISGRIRMVWSSSENKMLPGRFGHKAAKATLLEQIAGAFHQDMGITSWLHPEQNCSMVEIDCLNAFNPTDVEISKEHLNYVNLFVQSLAPPRPRIMRDKTDSELGKKLFEQINCSKCHRESFAVEDSIIRPYSDFLLHDMGPDLADNRLENGVESSEWRTPPLWGIGSQRLVSGHQYLLHDGRARNIEEAILWHGGEALKAKQSYATLTSAERALVIKFIESL